MHDVTKDILFLEDKRTSAFFCNLEDFSINLHLQFFWMNHFAKYCSCLRISWNCLCVNFNYCLRCAIYMRNCGSSHACKSFFTLFVLFFTWKIICLFMLKKRLDFFPWIMFYSCTFLTQKVHQCFYMRKKTFKGGASFSFQMGVMSAEITEVFKASQTNKKCY